MRKGNILEGILAGFNAYKSTRDWRERQKLTRLEQERAALGNRMLEHSQERAALGNRMLEHSYEDTINPMRKFERERPVREGMATEERQNRVADVGATEDARVTAAQRNFEQVMALKTEEAKRLGATSAELNEIEREEAYNFYKKTGIMPNGLGYIPGGRPAFKPRDRESAHKIMLSIFERQGVDTKDFPAPVQSQLLNYLMSGDPDVDSVVEGSAFAYRVLTPFRSNIEMIESTTPGVADALESTIARWHAGMGSGIIDGQPSPRSEEELIEQVKQFLVQNRPPKTGIAGAGEKIGGGARAIAAPVAKKISGGTVDRWYAPFGISGKQAAIIDKYGSIANKLWGIKYEKGSDEPYKGKK